MKKSVFGFILISLVVLVIYGYSYSEVKWDVVKTYQIEEIPVDVAVSPKWLFVLTDQGQVVIYSPNGRLIGKIPVGKAVDRIDTTLRDDMLFLSSSTDKTIKLLNLDFIQKISTLGPFKGAVNAAVVIAVFSDFQCPACATLVPVIDQVLEQYPANVKVVFKHYPLKSHTYSRQAAAAAIAADRQGLFWEYHDLLFKNHKQLNEQKIRDIAVVLGLDMEQFQKDLRDPQVQAIINQDRSEAAGVGVRSTPTVFINGKKLRDRTLKGFKSLIETELKNSGIEISQTGKRQ
jgi:thiol-disulfide isomerase/thioredoxin